MLLHCEWWNQIAKKLEVNGHFFIYYIISFYMQFSLFKLCDLISFKIFILMFHIVILVANDHVVMSPHNLIDDFYYNACFGKKTSFSRTYIYIYIMVTYSHCSQVWAKANIPIFKCTKHVLKIRVKLTSPVLTK